MLLVVFVSLLSLVSVVLGATTHSLLARDNATTTDITDDEFCGLIIESAQEGK
jgi:hypothetical protein